MSLLVDHGFHDAEFYPLDILILESEIVDERIRSMEATRATLMMGAVSSVYSKEAGNWFRRQIDRLLMKRGS